MGSNNTHKSASLVTHNTYHIIRVKGKNTLDGVDPVGWSCTFSSVDAAVISLPYIT